MSIFCRQRQIQGHYPTAFGKPATVPFPGCVCSHALGVCVCVCVCVFVCPHVLGRCNDALFHRCIRRFTDSSDASIHSSIHQCIKRVRCGSFVILFRYFSICCAVVVLISGLFWVSFCQSRRPFQCHFGVRGGLLATLCPPGVPREEQSRKCEQKGGSWVHPWTPQEHPKSIKINGNFKVCLCVCV